MTTTNTKIRVAAAAAAAAAVLAVIVFGALHHDGQRPDAGAAPSATGPSSATGASAEPEASHDDGVVDQDVSASPATINAGPAQPKEAAIQFMVKYLNTQGKTATQWRAGFRPLVTAELAEQLAVVEPERIPAGQVADNKVTAVLIGDALQLVTVPLLAGLQDQVVATVRVTLTGTSGRWLVSDLDLEIP